MSFDSSFNPLSESPGFFLLAICSWTSVTLIGLLLAAPSKPSFKVSVLRLLEGGKTQKRCARSVWPACLLFSHVAVKLWRCSALLSRRLLLCQCGFQTQLFLLEEKIQLYVKRPCPPSSFPSLMVIQFCIMLSCCRVSMRVSEKPCYCTYWSCSMCLEQMKKCCFKCFDKEINLLPVKWRLSVFSVLLHVCPWTVEGNGEQLVQLNLGDMQSFVCCVACVSLMACNTCSHVTYMLREQLVAGLFLVSSSMVLETCKGGHSK